MAGLGISPRVASVAAPPSLHALAYRSNEAKASALAVGLVCDLDARTLVQSNGAAITAWGDAANANPVTAGAATNVATGWSDGGPCANFVAASSQYLTDDTLSSLGSGDFSVAILFRLASLGSYRSLCGISATASPFKPYWQPYVAAGNTLGGQVVGTSASSGLQDGTSPVRTSEDTLAVYSWSASTKKFTVWCNGQKSTLDTSAAAGFSGANVARIGAIWLGTNSNGLDGTVRRFAAWSRQFTDADWRALVGLWGQHPSATHRVQCIFGGTSVDAGYNGTTDANPIQNYVYLPVNFVTTNTAVDSRTTVLVSANFATEVAARVSAQPCMPAIYAPDGTLGRNDIYVLGVSGAQAAANYFALCDKARAAGMFVVARTAIDCQNFGGGGGQPVDIAGRAQLQAFNSIIRSGWQGHVDNISDEGADPRLTDASKFADLIHPTLDQQRVRGAIVAPKIQAVGLTALDAMVLTA